MADVKNLLIVGAGGHGKVVLDCALAMGDYAGVSFLTNDLAAKQIAGFPVFYEQETILSSSFYENYDEIIIAIGNNNVRLAKSLQILDNGLKLATLIHPTAVVSRFSEVLEGTVVFANAVVNPFSSVGTACIINTGAIIEHDCILGNGVHVSPGATLAGSVRVGEKSWICAGSSLSNHIKIGTNSIVGAGATVLEDVPDNVLMAGVPAKIKKNYD